MMSISLTPGLGHAEWGDCYKRAALPLIASKKGSANA